MRRLYGMSVYCYELGPEGWSLVHKEHFIATNRDMARKLALDYIYTVQMVYARTDMLEREVA